MTGLIVPVILIPALDQALKLFALKGLGAGAIALGGFGELKVVRNRIWIVRACGVDVPVIWLLWITAAAALAAVCIHAPSLAWFAGLLLGGALSHLVETSTRGFVCDYICLRFWPAFNMADVSLTVGAAGLTVELARMIRQVLV